MDEQYAILTESNKAVKKTIPTNQKTQKDRKIKEWKRYTRQIGTKKIWGSRLLTKICKSKKKSQRSKSNIKILVNKEQIKKM